MLRPLRRTTGDKLLDEGRQEGRQEGRRTATLEILEAQLDGQFGPLTPEALAALRTLPDDRLKALALAWPKARSLADLGL